MMFFRGLFILGIFLTVAQAARSEVMDPEVRELLINKLQKIYSRVSSDNKSRVSVTLRLADLLSEKARYDTMKELQEGCLKCNAGEKERKLALKYYKEVLPSLKHGQRLKTLEQVGHLYGLLGKLDQAILYYQSIIKAPSYSDQERVDAFFSLGEIYFKQRRYGLALVQYNFVLQVKGKNIRQKSMAAYRRAWSLFNEGQVSLAVNALIQIIKTPELLVRGDVVALDQYKSEVSKDLATFMSKSTGGSGQVETLYELSPDRVKLDNVIYLASELERLGRPVEALEAYRFSIERQSKDKQKKFELYLGTFQLEKKLKNLNQALVDYQKALALWTEMGACQGDNCGEWRSRLRKFVLDWHRQESKSPSKFLLQSYQAYLQEFPLEVDMQVWHAQALKTKKNFKQAYKFYGDVIDLLLSGRGKKGNNNKEDLPTLESLLLTRVELAEEVGEEAILQEAYVSYLDKSKEKTQWLAVEYQLAYGIYKKGLYKEAALAFRKLALVETKQSIHLKKKAADLALDSLVLLKDDSRLEQWTREFAKIFPKGAKEYRAMERKSLFNQVANLAKADDLLISWAVLEKIDLKEAGEEEKLNYCRNKLVLAEKLNKFLEGREAANCLLSFKKLSKEDRQFALSRKAWLAEILFDFETALKATERLELKEFSSEEKVLKLALFAELSGKSPNPYYRRYLKQSKRNANPHLAYTVALKLVKGSSRPVNELLRQRNILGSNKEQFALMYLNEIAKLSHKEFAKHSQLILKDKQLASTPSGKFLWRQRFISRYEKMRGRVAKHQIAHKTQKTLSATINQRIKLLGEADSLLDQAVRGEDWTAQVLALNLLIAESARFHQDILSLPTPEGLNEAEQQEYLSLLSQQASPYRVRFEKLSEKLTEFWNHPKLVSQLQEQYRSSTLLVKNKLANEVKLVAQLAPKKLKKPLLEILNYKDPIPLLPREEDIKSLRFKVKKDPLDLELLGDLLDAEKKFGKTDIVSYLEDRLEKLKTMSLGES